MHSVAISGAERRGGARRAALAAAAARIGAPVAVALGVALRVDLGAAMRVAMRVAMGAWMVAALATPHRLAQAATLASPDLTVQEPVAHGLRVGDVVERELRLRLPPGAWLDEASLPQPRPEGALELRAVRRQGAADAATQRLWLRYQLMHSPEALAVYELPPVVLRVQVPGPTGPRETSLRAEAWPLVAGPLVPEPPPERRGLGPLQPDRPLPAWPIDPLRRQAAAWGALAALALAWLAWRHVGRPWVGRRQRPFARAWRALRGLGPTADPAVLSQALRRLHRALDEDAGRPLPAEQLPAWLAARPAYAGLQAELAAFFATSAAHFYAPPRPVAEGATPPTTPDPAEQVARVQGLARRLARQEAHA